MESSEGYISHNADRYILAGRSGLDDYVLSVGDVLELAIGGGYQTVCVWLVVSIMAGSITRLVESEHGSRFV